MKTFFTVILFFLICANSGFSQNTEFRSIWVVTWEYISSGSTPEVNKERIRSILDNMTTANMSSVLWQVRQAGTAYYNSSYEPYGSYAGGTYPGFDPLQYAVEEAHKRGLEIHAWFNVFASGSTAPGTPAQQHPEWICRDQDGIPMNANIALSPGLPEVRNYLNTVAMEVVRNYDIDGFHLDYIRWNEYSNSGLVETDTEEGLPDGMITAERLHDLEMNAAGRYLYDTQHPFSGGIPTGYSSWDEWWRSSVTEFVRVLHDSIQSVKPYVKLSVAALGNYNWGGWNGYFTVYQDAALWFNMGYIDQIAGMHYHWTTGDGFLHMLVNGCPNCWSQFIQPGIAAGRQFTVGPPSYILHENNIWYNHPGIVNSLRTVDWVDGFQFFSYASWKSRDYFSEAAELFLPLKTKQRNSIPSTEIVSTPSIQISKIDSFHYNLNVTTPAIDKPYWFIIYRSENNNFSRDTSDIVFVKFTDSAFTFEESFNGLQDFNGSYRYSVTMANRYWKESGLSNIVITDPIPSSAPFVTGTNPAQGDTVVLNKTIEIKFSKTMDLSNLSTCLSFNPPVEIPSVVTEPKRIVIHTAGFTNSTNYTLRIDSLLKDINGRMLDGNNDGIEGDPFYLNFTTVGVDSVGPFVVSVSPSTDDSLDIEDVVSIIFNEPLLKASVTDKVTLYKDGVVVPSAIGVGNFASGSVINLKPVQSFFQDGIYSCTVSSGIKDTTGNLMTGDFNFSFRARKEGYSEKIKIDDFSSIGGWQQPGFSGSTTGIMIPGTSITTSGTIYLPTTLPRSSLQLSYKWNPDETPHFLREYLLEGPPREVLFDTSYTLQVYVFGDGSGSLLRFAIDESIGSTWPNHEVSQWTVIDWNGWKLVEWDLGDPESVGTWIGNGILDGDLFRIDSFQLTDTPASSTQGVINFDNLRLVKKTYAIVSAEDEEAAQPLSFRLYQNYPNPFNPSTLIQFDLDKSGKINLDVYDILGRRVKTLISEELNAGHHEVRFDASDLASGQYIYRITSDGKQISKMMILMK